MLYILYFRKLYLHLVNAVLYLYLVDAILFLIEAYKQSELIINHSFRLFLNRNICTPAESISSMCSPKSADPNILLYGIESADSISII